MYKPQKQVFEISLNLKIKVQTLLHSHYTDSKLKCTDSFSCFRPFTDLFLGNRWVKAALVRWWWERRWVWTKRSRTVWPRWRSKCWNVSRCFFVLCCDLCVCTLGSDRWLLKMMRSAGIREEISAEYSNGFNSSLKSRLQGRGNIWHQNRDEQILRHLPLDPSHYANGKAE